MTMHPHQQQQQQQQSLPPPPPPPSQQQPQQPPSTASSSISRRNGPASAVGTISSNQSRSGTLKGATASSAAGVATPADIAFGSTNQAAFLDDGGTGFAYRVSSNVLDSGIIQGIQGGTGEVDLGIGGAVDDSGGAVSVSFSTVAADPATTASASHPLASANVAVKMARQASVQLKHYGSSSNIVKSLISSVATSDDRQSINTPSSSSGDLHSPVFSPISFASGTSSQGAGATASRKASSQSELASFTTSIHHSRPSASLTHQTMVFHLSAASSSSAAAVAAAPPGPTELSCVSPSGRNLGPITYFYVHLQNLTAPEAKPATLSLKRFEGSPSSKVTFRLRPWMKRLKRKWSSPEEFGRALNAQLLSAARRRMSLLADRKNRLRRRLDQVKFRVMLHRQQENLAILRLRTRGEYNMAAASLNRQMILKRNAEKFGAIVEHAQTVSVVQRLRRFMDLERVVSEAYAKITDSSVTRMNSVVDVDSTKSKLAALHSSMRFLADWASMDLDDLSGGKEIQSILLSSAAGGDTLPEEDYLAEEIDLPTSFKLGSSAFIDPSDSESEPTPQVARFGNATSPSTVDFELPPLGSFPDSGSFDPKSSRLSALPWGPNSDSRPLHDITGTSPYPASGMDQDDILSPSELGGAFLSAQHLQSSSSSSTSPSPNTFTNDSVSIFASPSHQRLTSNTSEAGPRGTPLMQTPTTNSHFSLLAQARNDLSGSFSPVKTDTSPELLIQFVNRTKQLPVHLFDELVEDDYLDLSSLLPPITRFTLRELNMDEILSNAQLRHDLYFDPNLQFKPNTDGDRGDQRKARSDMYWSQVEAEVLAGQTYRLPLLLFEIRTIIIEMLPYADNMKESVESNLDIRLIAQQLEHNVLNVDALIQYLADLLKANCAPARDVMVDAMLAAAKEGSFVSAIRICFELVEMMKLDYANHQLLRLRPYVVENCIAFEWNWFQEELKAGTSTLSATKSWFIDSYNRFEKSQSAIPPSSALPSSSVARPPIPPFNSVFADGILYLLQHCPALFDSCTPLPTSATPSLPSPPPALPETLKMDSNRLLTFRNDWQDITIMATLLILFRQASGPRCTPAHQSEMKSTLWVLLNDTDTSLAHIVLEMARTAGTIRGRRFEESEELALSGLVEKTLAPDSRLYGLVWARVGEHLRDWIVKALERGAGGSTGAAADVAALETPDAHESFSSSSESESDSDSDSDSESDSGPFPRRQPYLRPASRSKVPSATKSSHRGPPSALPSRLGSNSSAVSTASTARSATAATAHHSSASLSLNSVLLAKHGLTELETEVRDLAERLGKLCEFNRATYFEVYRQLYEDATECRSK
ncbi:T-complex protein 11-domain-containing protein [Zopfochytrium polystomum]|nr:T-complex protein 11-domain-containing protein [Zopfochytrium polystomum]